MRHLFLILLLSACTPQAETCGMAYYEKAGGMINTCSYWNEQVMRKDR